MKRRLEFAAELDILHHLGERRSHARHPGVALGASDRKWHVTPSQTRMAALARVQRWATHPFDEETREHVLDRREISGVKCANLPGFGQAIHVMVKPLDQLDDHGLPAYRQ